ncbi:MAG TPA: hypothetical protein VHO24_20115 [Opitutaceae bacterium]|nr:hypothetical protein [Opitutaceae bacterium]
MKTKSSLVIAACCCLLTAVVAAENESAKERPAASRPAATSTPVPSSAEKEKPADSAAKLSPALAASRANEEAKRAHILPASGPFKMETPPPAPRTETKPPTPVAGYVWMPGHWAPVKGQWQWTPGEWGNPPTAASVWIEGKYDPKTKEWTAGYWQPDRAQSYEPDVLEKEPAPSPKY